MNMSYCRFENTLNDLIDCRRALQNMKDGNDTELGDSELQAAKALTVQCFELLEWLRDLHPGSDEESMDDVHPETWHKWIEELNEDAEPDDLGDDDDPEDYDDVADATPDLEDENG